MAAATTTPVPDEIFDEWLGVLGEAELKVLLYIVRRTFGFDKRAGDSISYKQFLEGIRTRDGRVLDRGCGIHNRTNLSRALTKLERKGLVRSFKSMTNEGDKAVTFYALWFERDETLDRDDPRLAAPRASSPAQPARGGTVPAPGTTASAPRTIAPVPPRAEQALPGGADTVSPEVLCQHLQETAGQQTAGQETGHSKSSDGRSRASRTTGSHGAEDFDASTRNHTNQSRNGGTPNHPQVRLDPEYRALVRPIKALGAELGDEAPGYASITRAYNLMRAAGIPLDDFLPLIGEAAALTLAHDTSITKTRQAPGTSLRKNSMPYFFATLERLLHSDGNRPRQKLSPTHESGSVAPTLEQASAEIPSPQEHHPVWRAVLDELRLELTDENYAMWLAPTQVIRCDDNLLYVDATKPFHRDWLDYKLRGRIEAILRRLGHADIHVEFVVDS